jgi:hypothetical protein
VSERVSESMLPRWAIDGSSAPRPAPHSTRLSPEHVPVSDTSSRLQPSSRLQRATPHAARVDAAKRLVAAAARSGAGGGAGALSQRRRVRRGAWRAGDATKERDATEYGHDATNLDEVSEIIGQWDVLKRSSRSCGEPSRSCGESSRSGEESSPASRISCRALAKSRVRVMQSGP